MAEVVVWRRVGLRKMILQTCDDDDDDDDDDDEP